MRKNVLCALAIAVRVTMGFLQTDDFARFTVLTLLSSQMFICTSVHKAECSRRLCRGDISLFHLIADDLDLLRLTFTGTPPGMGRNPGLGEKNKLRVRAGHSPKHLWSSPDQITLDHSPVSLIYSTNEDLWG